jgi:glycine cleavage system H protein
MKNLKISLAWQILLALVLGILLGSYLHYHSDSREWLILNLLSPAGDIFIHLIKMIVVPIVISTLVVGIAGVGDAKQLGRIGVKTDGTYTVGITEHAQELLGDMVFVDLPDVGTTVSAGDDCAVAESVKAASDIYAPVSGEIVAVNDALSDSPELVNSEPYEGGWIFKIKASDEAQVAALLDATAYEALLEDE